MALVVCNRSFRKRFLDKPLNNNLFLRRHTSFFKMPKYITLFPFLFFCLAIFSRCGAKKEEIIAEKVAERVDEFRKEKTMECRTQLLQNAEKIVDSLLLLEATNSVQDSLARLRPSRPVKPADIPAIDSQGIKPVFGGE
jgi:hypothetical protein